MQALTGCHLNDALEQVVVTGELSHLAQCAKPLVRAHHQREFLRSPSLTEPACGRYSKEVTISQEQTNGWVVSVRRPGAALAAGGVLAWMHVRSAAGKRTQTLHKRRHRPLALRRRKSRYCRRITLGLGGWAPEEDTTLFTSMGGPSIDEWIDKCVGAEDSPVCDQRGR